MDFKVAWICPKFKTESYNQILESDLALVPAVEELWEGALLDGVDPVVVEPRAVRRNDDVVSLQ